MIRHGGEDVATRRRCELLEVSRSGYYRWLSGRARDADRESVEIALRAWVRSLHRRWSGLLGYRRMTAMLQIEHDIETSERTIRRIMSEDGLSGRPGGRKSRRGGRSKPPVAEDLLHRDFTADAPNRRWVSDITEFSTRNGKFFLCQVKDLYDGAIAGWSMGDRATAELVVRALSMAWRERMDRGERIVLHSDRGTQYTSETVAKWLDEHDMVASMGAVGSSADNASAESFFGLLKRDLGNEVRSSTRSEAAARIHDYIVNLYNPLRRASGGRVPQPKLARTEAKPRGNRKEPKETSRQGDLLDSQVST